MLQTALRLSLWSEMIPRFSFVQNECQKPAQDFFQRVPRDDITVLRDQIPAASRLPASH